MASFLNSNGLTHLWSNLKTLLDGKANSSHTHSIVDVNQLQSELNSRIKPLSTAVTARPLPSINIGEMKSLNDVRTDDASISAIKLPSGGSYLVLTIGSSPFDLNSGIFAGGSTVGTGYKSSDYYTPRYYSGFYIRIT